MGFISFNETYYADKLEKFENKKLNAEDIYEIQQLLKVLDDLEDEGYTNLNRRMEEDFFCISRLRALLAKEGAASFEMPAEKKISSPFTEKEYELSALLDTLIKEAKESEYPAGNPFLKDIHDYCQWIDYKEDTAYVFLLRDTLLPYVYFKNRHNSHVYPWLISRKFLEKVTGIDFIDDDIRLPIYEALEKEHTDFEECCAYCRKPIRNVLNKYPELKQNLLDLLSSLKEKHIVVIESGYMGTIPMMLKTLDDRVDFRLYTTAPFLYTTYENRIFCKRYEDIRKFETVYAQDHLLQYSSFQDGKFYVNITCDTEIKEKSLAEIHFFLKQKSIKNH